MRVYLDASIVVALLTRDSLTAKAEKIVLVDHPTLVVSDFAAAEFASAISRRVRTGHLTAEEASAAFTLLDRWLARRARMVETTAGDVALAAQYLRRVDVALRTPDALNIAIAVRVGTAIATLDRQMAVAARTLGAEVVAA